MATETIYKLDGMWNLLPDPENAGKDKGWFHAIPPEAREAPVPDIIQQVFPDVHGVAWYWRLFRLHTSPQRNQRCLLRFWAVDYLADVWLNGVFIGRHEGGETPFAFDITDVVHGDGDNLLAVRVLNPTDEPVEGFTLGQIPHRNKVPRGIVSGSSFNYGGIVQSVEILLLPAVRIADIFAQPNMHTGEMKVNVTVHNHLGATSSGEILLLVGPDKGGEIIATNTFASDFPAGEICHEVSVIVPHPHLWDIDDPYLYRVTIRLKAGCDQMEFQHQRSVRSGFRELRVERGFFRLNGRRIFIRSTHTGNHFPIGECLPPTPDLLRKDLLYAKSLGLNMVRFIAGLALPDQLDFCDEIGLMVYEENMASWCLEDSPAMAQRYDCSLREMIRRDRNHPSVVIWGLLNETTDGAVFRHAVDALSTVRSLDPTRLVLLSSGRWDRQLSIGSVSNPWSKTWEHQWGAEAPGAPEAPSSEVPAYVPGMGDVHVYPTVPQTPSMNEFFRQLGSRTKPVFLSEYGIGSLFNAIREARFYEQAGAGAELSDASFIRSIAERFEADWKRWGFEGVYPFAEDVLRESQRLHCRQRRLGFDLIRANPQICGYSLTGMLDHGFSGEGLWTFWRELKPNIADTLADGLAPLRWCLFAEPAHVYAGQPLKLEAVLASEDVLTSGDYPATFRVVGPNGIVREEKAVVHIPEPGPGEELPLAFPVWHGEMSLDAPSGKYVFAAQLDKGGAPTGGRLEFYLSNPNDLPAVDCRAGLLGADKEVEAWLRSRGVQCYPFGHPVTGREIILAGKVPPEREVWQELVSKVVTGSMVVFLDPTSFRKDENSTYWLPLRNKGRCYEFYDWLYHKECVAKPHPAFSGMPTGIMDWDYYGPLIPRTLFEGQDEPDEVIAAAFAVAYHCPGGYASGVLLACYSLGAGAFVLNTLPILENLGRHPAADRLLLNLVQWLSSQAGKPLASLPGDFQNTLKAIGYSAP